MNAEIFKYKNNYAWRRHRSCNTFAVTHKSDMWFRWLGKSGKSIKYTRIEDAQQKNAIFNLTG